MGGGCGEGGVVVMGLTSGDGGGDNILKMPKRQNQIGC